MVRQMWMVIVLVGLAAITVGCNTVAGFGRDMELTGHAITGAATQHGASMDDLWDDQSDW